MDPMLFQAGMQMLQGGPLSEGGGALGGMLGGGAEEEPSVSTDVEVKAALKGGPMITTFGGEGTNLLVILGVVAIIFILAK